MTYLSSTTILEESRRNGTAPQGGPAPEDAIKKIREIPAISELKPGSDPRPGLEFAGFTAQKYPNDFRVHNEISRVMGYNVARATLLDPQGIERLVEEATDRIGRPHTALNTVAFSGKKT